MMTQCIKTLLLFWSCVGYTLSLPTDCAAASKPNVLASHFFGYRLSKEEDSVEKKVLRQLEPLEETVDAIEFYGVRVNAERRFSYGVQPHRTHLFVRFISANKNGWAEVNLGTISDDVTMDELAEHFSWYRNLIGKSLPDALDEIIKSRDQQSWKSLEMAEIAVLDLAGRHLGKSALELMSLNERAPVPGLFAILSDDPIQVKRQAALALEQNLRSHLKVKLYGKTDIDQAVVRAAREVYGPEAYLIGDVNMGYRRKGNADTKISEIEEHLLRLRKCGLSACEDPAEMTASEWADLQQRVGSLDLIPDVPMRPSWKALRDFESESGNVFNLHPGSMGSILQTVELAQTIKSQGKRLMIGDASLVGPGCTVWEQMAIGLGADWVEAIEKPQESNVIQECQTANAVRRNAQGLFELNSKAGGFGLEVDTTKLGKRAFGVARFP